MKTEKIVIQTEFIKLGSFLKFAGAVATGSDAKEVIISGQVAVNGEVCTQRGKKIKPLDKIEFNGVVYEVFSE